MYNIRLLKQEPAYQTLPDGSMAVTFKLSETPDPHPMWSVAFIEVRHSDAVAVGDTIRVICELGELQTIYDRVRKDVAKANDQARRQQDEIDAMLGKDSGALRRAQKAVDDLDFGDD
jgi:acyl dehydratase